MRQSSKKTFPLDPDMLYNLQKADRDHDQIVGNNHVEFRIIDNAGEKNAAKEST